MPERSCQLGHKGASGAFELEHDGQRVDHFDRLDRADFASPHAAFDRERAHQREPHRLAFTGSPSWNCAPWRNRITRWVGLCTQNRRKLRDDFQVRRNVEQFVAQPGEHDAPDIAGSESGRGDRVLPQANMDTVSCARPRWQRRRSGQARKQRQRKSVHGLLSAALFLPMNGPRKAPRSSSWTMVSMEVS